ncbi:unnamed protein product [Paramecium sonneborni]|uniref:Transmembrane protein n=1 Tax=Paramecium sonneborni TaxID=65129 RepID=A0A8S1QVQ5_9CILI|nr:unnamed protein product [Paramecium sonneborni]
MINRIAPWLILLEVLIVTTSLSQIGFLTKIDIEKYGYNTIKLKQAEESLKQNNQVILPIMQQSNEDPQSVVFNVYHEPIQYLKLIIAGSDHQIYPAINGQFTKANFKITQDAFIDTNVTLYHNNSVFNFLNKLQSMNILNSMIPKKFNQKFNLIHIFNSQINIVFRDGLNGKPLSWIIGIQHSVYILIKGKKIKIIKDQVIELQNILQMIYLFKFYFQRQQIFLASFNLLHLIYPISNISKTIFNQINCKFKTNL